MTDDRTIEEILRFIEDRAAMLQFMANAATGNTDFVPEPAVFSGIADACGEIEQLARATRRSLDVEALSGHLKKRRA